MRPVVAVGLVLALGWGREYVTQLPNKILSILAETKEYVGVKGEIIPPPPAVQEVSEKNRPTIEQVKKQLGRPVVEEMPKRGDKSSPVKVEIVEEGQLPAQLQQEAHREAQRLIGPVENGKEVVLDRAPVEPGRESGGVAQNRGTPSPKGAPVEGKSTAKKSPEPVERGGSPVTTSPQSTGKPLSPRPIQTLQPRGGVPNPPRKTSAPGLKPTGGPVATGAPGTTTPSYSISKTPKPTSQPTGPLPSTPVGYRYPYPQRPLSYYSPTPTYPATYYSRVAPTYYPYPQSRGPAQYPPYSPTYHYSNYRYSPPPSYPTQYQPRYYSAPVPPKPAPTPTYYPPVRKVVPAGYPNPNYPNYYLKGGIAPTSPNRAPVKPPLSSQPKKVTSNHFEELNRPYLSQWLEGKRGARLYLDPLQPIQLREIAGRSFIVNENYVDNTPIMFQFDSNGIARLYYKGRPVVLQLENGTINLYDKEGNLLAYFQKLASDPVVGLILVGFAVDKNRKVTDSWVDFWQYSTYIPPRINLAYLLPYRIFDSWTSRWYRDFRGDGIVDYFVYSPKLNQYTKFYQGPFQVINGNLVVEDGNLVTIGGATIETTFTESISQMAQVGRYRVVTITFSSYRELQDPQLVNKRWEDLVGRYWIDGWFKLLPNRKIEVANGKLPVTGSYQIEGNLLLVTFKWNGRYTYTDRYYLDPTSGVIRNSFQTSFWDVVSSTPIVKITSAPELPPTQGPLKELFIDAYIHHLKRKHFF